MIQTALTRMFGLDHPIVLGPMGGVSGGKLAAAVSNAGGLGLVGGGYGDAAWLRKELAHVKQATTRPWGIGFITWSVESSVLDLALGSGAAAIMLSFGDPLPYGRGIRKAGCKLLCQVQSVEQAKRALEAGADVIVAEGNEAGGHSGLRGTLPLVPAVVDAAAPVPVVAAGGIADGRGLAAALMLGAHGVLMGTRFYASNEALGAPDAKRRLVAGTGDDTVRTRIFDIVRGYDWPAEFPGRALRNDFVAQWHGREPALAQALEVEAGRYQAAARAGDCRTAVVWAGEVVDLIGGLESAATLVRRIGSDAETLLRTASRWTA